MTDTPINLSPSSETGRLGIMHLKRYWEKCIAQKKGTLAPNAFQEEWNTDITMLAALGLGLEQTLKQVYHSSPDFDAFEQWVIEVNKGKPMQEKIDVFNKSLIQDSAAVSAERIANEFSVSEINSWNENGYIILRNVVPKEDCEATIDVICNYINVKRNDPATWYNEHPAKQGIMVQLFQHPQLQKNREAEKIKQAYEELWGRKDIWLNTDRVGFNPPETTNWKFPGPDLHWDVSLKLPIPFGLQGILYLSDTAANQGAFTLVPGFHKKVKRWMTSLPSGANPRNQDIHALGAIPVVADAGDFIIWHHALPHGSSPNTASIPRFVQYINYAPHDMEIREEWI